MDTASDLTNAESEGQKHHSDFWAISGAMNVSHDSPSRTGENDVPWEIDVHYAYNFLA